MARMQQSRFDLTGEDERSQMSTHLRVDEAGFRLPLHLSPLCARVEK